MALASILASALALRAPALYAPRRSGARSRIRACAITDAEEQGVASAAAPEQWVALAMRERYPILRDISSSILTRRTLEEAELALKVEEDFRNDPSLFADIDFEQLIARIETDRSPENRARLKEVMTEAEFANVTARWGRVAGELEALLPTYSSDQRNITSGVAAAVPKIKRVIEKAREIPLTVDLPSPDLVQDVDVGAVMQESKNVATGLRNVWSRINGRGVREEDLQELQKEAQALLQLRAEATKLRASIRLVQRQKELKASFLIKTNDNDFLEQTLMADVSIARLEKELSLKVAFLEMERIFITLESELRASSTLVDQLLSVVERYGSMEASLRTMVVEAAEGRHSAIDMDELAMLEADVGDILLQLGLKEVTEQEKISWARTRDNAVLTLKKTQQGLVFYWRGVQLIGQDLQLAANMLVRAVLQGYTLRSREVRLLRRILKDLVTLVPFVIILIIPLSPLGHVLVFSFIQARYLRPG